MIVSALLKQGRLIQTKSTLQVLLLCSNQNDSQTFKSSSCKKHFLQCVCYRCNLLRWMFFISCGSWKTLLLIKVCRQFATLLTAILLLFLKQVFCKKSVFYVFYLHSPIVITVKCKYQISKIKLSYTKFVLNLYLSENISLHNRIFINSLVFIRWVLEVAIRRFFSK